MGTIVLILLYLAVPAAQIALYLRALPFFDPWEVLNFGASIALYCWMMASVVISAKVPLLQKTLPHDGKIRFHVLGSLGILAGLVYHTVYKLALGKQIDWVSWSLLAIPALLLLLAVLWIPVPGLRKFRDTVGRVAKRVTTGAYDTMKSVHGWLFLGMSALMLLHLARAETFPLVGPYSTALYIGELALAVGLYAFGKLRWLFLPLVPVLEVRRQDGIHVLRVRKPEGFTYRAGQFAFLKLEAPNIGAEEHPFSFLSTPDEPELAFAVRDLGDYTRRLAALRPGVQARVAGSFGGFHPRDEQALCLIASGIGAVPIVALVKDLARRHDTREIRCYVSVDRLTQVPDLEELRKAAETTLHLDLRILVREVDGLQYSTEYLASEIEDPGAYSYYVCCSPRVKDIVMDALHTLGVGRGRIHHESFAFG